MPHAPAIRLDAFMQDARPAMHGFGRAEDGIGARHAATIDTRHALVRTKRLP